MLPRPEQHRPEVCTECGSSGCSAARSLRRYHLHARARWLQQPVAEPPNAEDVAEGSPGARIRRPLAGHALRYWRPNTPAPFDSAPDPPLSPTSQIGLAALRSPENLSRVAPFP